MKHIINFLFFLIFATSNPLHAMDLQPKPLTPEEKLDLPLTSHEITGRDVLSPIEIQKIAQEIITPVIKKLIFSKTIKSHFHFPGGIASVSFSLDGAKAIVTAYEGKTAWIWDVNNGQFLHTLTDYEPPLWACSCSFSPNYTKVITANSGDQIFSIWLKNPRKIIQWLTNKLPDQKTFLLPDQAEIIRNMYDAHQNGNQLTVTMSDAVSFNKLPDYVKSCLAFSFGTLKLIHNSKEQLHNNQQEKPLTNTVVNDNQVVKVQDKTGGFFKKIYRCVIL